MYDISFDLAGNPDGGNPIKTLEVNWNGAQAGIFTFDTSGHTHGSMGWIDEFLTVVGTENNILQFQSLDDPSSGWGPSIDAVDISLAAVPEPTIYQMSALLLVSCVGLAYRRRWRWARRVHGPKMT